MVWWWWIVPAVVAVFGLAIVLSGLGWIFRGRPFKGGRGIFGGGLVLAIGAALSLLGLNVQTYHRLGEAKREVATIEFRAVQGQARTYDVTLTEPPAPDGTPGQVHQFQAIGDDWVLRARVLRWKPWATVLGLDSQYRLDRFESSYRDIQTARTVPPSVEPLRPARSSGIDLLPVARTVAEYVPLVDIPEYGQAVFWPMADGARYRVDITAQGQMLPDELNEQAENATAQWGTNRPPQQ